jgi:hypothetical protein
MASRSLWQQAQMDGLFHPGWTEGRIQTDLYIFCVESIGVHGGNKTVVVSALCRWWRMNARNKKAPKIKEIG